MVDFLPGPVAIHCDVQRALLERPESHRSPSFRTSFASTQALLCHAAGARHAEILLGSGTLANDAIAGQLSLLSEPGLVLGNGEFGERLADHAARFGLACEVMRWPWGQPFDLAAIEERLSVPPLPGWIWYAHVETSTGVLNDFDTLNAICRRAGVKMCVDAISSFGTTPVDLRDVHFASAVSGKGLRAFAGLAIVFHNHDIEPSPGRLPRYIDLGLYARSDGVPFTHSSNLLRALETSLDRVDWPKRFRIVAEMSVWLRARLRRRGFDIVAPEEHAAPGFVTVALPAAIGSARVGCELRAQGYSLAIDSEYLKRRNWIQISLMSEPSLRHLRAVVNALSEIC